MPTSFRLGPCDATSRSIRSGRGLSYLIVVASAVMLGACASTDDGTPLAELATGSVPAAALPLAANQARLTLTRVGGVTYAGVPAAVKVNGQKVADVGSGNTTTVAVPAGPLKVSVEAWSYGGAWTIDVDAKPGSTTALEITPREDAFLPSMLGPIGAMLDEASNGANNAGAFQVRVTQQTEAAAPPPAAPTATPPAKSAPKNARRAG